MSTLTDISTDAEFTQHITALPSSALLVLNFHAPWAAPCAQMRTLLTTLASTYSPTTPPTISFLSLNAEELADISESYDVTAVPFLVLQRDGAVLESISGCDATKVRSAVERHVGKGSANGAEAGLPEKLEIHKREENDTANGGAKNLAAYAPSPSAPQRAPEQKSGSDLASADPNPMTSQEELNKRLEGLVKAAPVMLFMKGTPSSPQCGFSRTLVGLLRERGVRYGFFNILADDDVRQGLKAWAEWPTFPQLWVGGELVGGLDIVKEELENDPDFFEDYSVGKVQGGMAAPEGLRQPTAA